MSFCQLSSIFPLIAYVIRIQFFGTFYKDVYPSLGHIVVFGIIAMVTCVLVLLIFIEQLAAFIGYVGSSTGLFLIYVIPLLVNAIYYKIKHPVSLLSRTTSKLSQEKVHINGNHNNSQEDSLITPSSNNEDDNDYFGSDFGLGISEKKPNKCIDNLFYFGHIFLCLFGLFTLVLQFLPINFFDVELKKEL